MDNELLNIEMDLLAGIAYKLPYEMQTQSNQEVLPAKKIAVYPHGNKITSHLKKMIIHACHAPAMELYVSHKHNLNDYDMDHINWNGLKSMMSKQKMNQCAISSKLIHGWLPTSNNGHHLHAASQLSFGFVRLISFVCLRNSVGYNL